MNLEIFASIGLVIFTFLLIQIARMKSPGQQDTSQNSPHIIPAYISDENENNQSVIREYYTDEKFIKDDTLN